MDISKAGPLRRPYIPLSNRQRFPRTKSGSNAFGMLTQRLHRSPGVDIVGVVAVHSGMEASSVGSGGTGLQPLANDCNVATTIMASADQSGPGTASLGGAARSFRYAGATTGLLKAGQFLVSDPLALWMPKQTVFRARSWIVPFGGTGVVPYGSPILGYTTTGGSLSGMGQSSAFNDGACYNANAVDLTQTSGSPTGGFATTTGDACYEPVLMGIPASYVRSWMILGDSISAGQSEYLTTATINGAGDAYGNVGHWERACEMAGHTYLNMAVPGAAGTIYATDGYASHMLSMGAMCCDGAIIAFGTNDISGRTAAQILTMLRKLVNVALAMGMTKVIVSTIPPRVNTQGAPITDLASQTENTSTPWPWATINSVNTSLRAGAITGATVVDINAIFRDAVETNKWRVDGGAWTYEGTHPTIYGATQAASQIYTTLRDA